MVTTAVVPEYDGNPTPAYRVEAYDASADENRANWFVIDEEDDAYGGAPHLIRRPRRRARPAMAPVPPVAPFLYPVVGTLTDELIRETNGRDISPRATPTDKRSYSAARQMDRDARGVFI